MGTGFKKCAKIGVEGWWAPSISFFFLAGFILRPAIMSKKLHEAGWAKGSMWVRSVAICQGWETVTVKNMEVDLFEAKLSVLRQGTSRRVHLSDETQEETVH